MLKGKTVILGITGSIAAYKIANLASMLVKQHCDVHVIMTENATNFINPITFESLTNNKCLVETFDRNFQFHIAHVSLAQKADAMLIAPASANIIAKLAHGIADDMLSTTALACNKPILVSPAMNTRMYENPITQDNIETLRNYDFTIIEPETGRLACNDIGSGKMVSETVLMDYLMREIACEKDLYGKKILITAGPTREAIDPVRFISNHSTGKMGYALARQAMLRGADVTLVTGPTTLTPPPFVEVVSVESAKDMFEEVITLAANQDIIIKSAAVADYKPSSVATEKIKKKEDTSVMELVRTQDILSHLGANKKDGQILCGFSMETENLIENSRKKLEKKHADMIVANNLQESGAGFGTDTNVVTIITKEDTIELPILSKDEVANRILNKLICLH
ncbi:MAG: bifunctional phosphopantothenoylcysteine decarboxylase/phosphopantothenate--cysteine ligase CoaBC [Lachnospiraceae bacterium]|nr:bifunctional phosphopantothenoylcysteine decarboxylase/phosphopantothenate--cysteine ligase CoaBC [Lachnospiraceae bacterium]